MPTATNATPCAVSLPAIAYTKPDQGKWKTVQILPVAGFQYYQGETLWPQLDTSQLLTLTREAKNPYDERAVRVNWQGHKLGHIPRVDNTTVSQQLDRRERLEAIIVELKEGSNRIMMEVQ